MISDENLAHIDEWCERLKKGDAKDRATLIVVGKLVAEVRRLRLESDRLKLREMCVYRGPPIGFVGERPVYPLPASDCAPFQFTGPTTCAGAEIDETITDGDGKVVGVDPAAPGGERTEYGPSPLIQLYNSFLAGKVPMTTETVNLPDALPERFETLDPDDPVPVIVEKK